MNYLIDIKISIEHDKDVDFRTAILNKLIGSLDGQRIVNENGTGTIQIIEIEVERIASN